MLLEYAGGAKLYVPLTRMDLVQRFRGAGDSVPALDRMGGATWTPHQDPRQGQNARHGRRAAQALRLPQNGRRLRLLARQQLAARIRRRLRVHRNPRPADRHQGDQARYGKPASHGPPAVRRCGLRQDRSGHARGFQGHGRRQAGGRAGAHHSPRFPALRNLQAPLPAVPHPRRNVQPLSHAEGDESRAGGPGGGQGGSGGGHAPPALGRRGVQGSGPGDGGRGAALRREAQGTPEAAQAERGRDQHERHADPAHTTHVVAGIARYVGDRNAAQGPAFDSD